MTKVCSPTKGCGIEKVVSEFHKIRNSYAHICKTCFKQYRQQYRKKNKEKIKQLQKKYCSTDKAKELSRLRNKRYRENSNEKRLLTASKYRAKQKGLEHNITLEDIQIPEYCPLLDIKLKSNVNNLTANDNSPSIDRIDNNKGYIKGNVRVISYRANAIKNNATIEELEKIVKALKRLSNEESQKITGTNILFVQ